MPCASNCETCSALGCSTCMDNYFLTQSQSCSADCILPCATCSSSNPTKCMACVAGYIYSSTSNTCAKVI